MLLLITLSSLIGFYGILISVLLTALLLNICEISYVHIKIFKKLKGIIKIVLINILLAIGLIVFWNLVVIPYLPISFISVFIGALSLLFLNTTIILFINFIIFPNSKQDLKATLLRRR